MVGSFVLLLVRLVVLAASALAVALVEIRDGGNSSLRWTWCVGNVVGATEKLPLVTIKASSRA